MRRGVGIALVSTVLLLGLSDYVWMHRGSRSFTGSVVIRFDWSESGGFRQISVESPHWGSLYSKLIANQAKPYIAREFENAGWRSGQGRLNVGAFLMLFVQGVDHLSEDNWKIIDPEVTPLMRAVEDGNSVSAERLISEGADVNARDQRGRTALMHASITGHTKEAAILVASGASLNVEDKDGRTALFLAAQNCRSDVALLLSHAGADAKRDRYGYSAIESTICPGLMQGYP